MRMNKKGVSLVTVLLFMLVATIAATATFKWLTSENSSSSSRMMMNEARQSATAGLDAARSWMTYNANDVGAMLKSYFDGDKKPVKLNSVLNPLTKDGQHYDVFLTAVNTENSSYKMKLVSVGKARNGKAKYSESAILKVNGLYQVNVPTEQTALTFDQAFHGRIGKITSNNYIESGIINGNLVGNIPTVERQLMVTGNLTYQGGSGVGGDLYVGGDFSNQGSFFVGYDTTNNSCSALDKVVYIGGSLRDCAGAPFIVCGDLHVNGSVRSAYAGDPKCALDIGGNLTIGREFRWGSNKTRNYSGQSNRSNKTFYVGGNFVFKDDATYTKMYVTGDAFDGYVGVNMYYPPSIDGNCGGNCGDQNGNRRLTIGGDAYKYTTNYYVLLNNVNGATMGSGVFMQGTTQNGINKVSKERRIFSFSASSVNQTPTVSKWSKTDNVLKNVGNNYWDNYDKMMAYKNMTTGTNDTVPQPILLKDSTSWLGKIANSGAGNPCSKAGYEIDSTKNLTSSAIANINGCHEKLTAAGGKDLYNGFLVVRIAIDQLNSVSETDTLKYNTVLYIPSAANSNMRLPYTAKDATVMLYFANGMGSDKGLQNGSDNSKADYHHYFIYSDGVIDKMLDGLTIQGSMVMANGSEFQDLNNGKLVFEESVLKSLANAGIIKENPDYTKLVDPDASSSASSGGSEASSVKDTYFISTSPQLSISLESQYKNDEIDPDDLTGDNVIEISPSHIVLPRIIYLTQDPVGKLSDYYTVLGLNGAENQEGSQGVTCPSGLSTSGDLYNPDNPVLIRSGLFTCTYKKDQEEIPFYVMVSGKNGKNPLVSFVTNELETTANASVPVKLKLKKGDRQITVTIMAPSAGNLESGWNYTTQSGTALVKDDGVTSVYEWKGTPTTDTEVTVFNVVTTSAGQGDLIFQLTDPCDGCIIGSPSIERVFVTGTSTIERKELEEYCVTYPDNCTDENDYENIAKRPNCGTIAPAEWIRASGTNCVVNTANDSWTCGTNTAISLASGTSSEYCDLFIPTVNNSIDAPQDDVTYPLYASLKRKPYTLTVKREGSTISEVQVFTSSTAGPFGTTPTHVCKDDVCEYEVYADQRVQLKYDLKGSDKFSYWRSTSPNSPTTEPVPDGAFTLQPISANNTVLAKFNDRDKHCFYEDFTELKAFCDDKKECIMDCNAGGKGNSCSVDYENSVANWQLGYGNAKNGGNLAPDIDNSNGTITAPKGQKGNPNSGNGTQTIIMSTKLTGKNGKMSAMLQTTIFKSNGQNNEGVNSGFIFRSGSDAAKYLILNIFGYGDKNNATSGVLTARLCVAQGQSSTNSTGICQEAEFITKHLHDNLTISQNTMITLNVTVDGDKMDADATVDGRTGYLSFDLTDPYDVNGDYLGMAVSDSWFKLYDFGWESTSFPNEGCFEVPTLNCSFKANYLGGIVPKDSSVYPWAAASSWFGKNNCNLEYYYNGNDNNTSMTSDALYGYKLTSSEYNFSEEGMHGPDDKDAVVVVKCLGIVKTSLDGKNASCGNFQVGSVQVCSKNYDILTSTQSYVGYDLEIPTPNATNGINLRKSDLWLKISNLAENQTISVYMKDAAGKISQAGYIYANGDQAVSVDVMSNVELFDPQKVVSIILSGTSNFDVSSIQSSCPYALNVSSCSAWYDGTSWQISSTITNPSSAKANGCSVDADDSGIEDLSDVTCPSDGRFVLPDADFYTELNKNTSSQTYKFTIHAKDRNGEEVPTCEATATYKPVDITCSVNDVVKGGVIPDVSFSVTNCPTAGCPYTLTLDGNKVKTGTYGGSSATAGATGSTSEMSENSEHTYTIDAMGKTKDCKFKVLPQEDAEGSCSISGSVVSVDIKGANYKNVAVALVYSDAIGNVLGHNLLNINQNLSTEVDLATKNLTAGTEYTVTLKVGETDVACGKYTAPEEAPDVSVTCPEDVSDHDPASAISVTPTVTGCAGGCSWSMTPATADGSGSNYTSGEISFYNASGSGTVSHTLTVSNGTKSDDCSFNVAYKGTSSSSGTSDCIAFVNGVWGHDKHCYNSGLDNMTSGKCYTLNPERDDAQWINQDASDSYWWVETPCIGSGSGGGSTSSSSAKSSSSATPASSASPTTSTSGGGSNIEFEIVNNNYPDKQREIPSGSCLSLTGKWTNSGYHPTPSIKCDAMQNGCRGIRITYGSKDWTATDNTKQSLGVQIYNSDTKVTYIENVCVYSTDCGTSVKCKFEN